MQYLYLLDGLIYTDRTMRTAGSYQVDEAFEKPPIRKDNWNSKMT